MIEANHVELFSFGWNVNFALVFPLSDKFIIPLVVVVWERSRVSEEQLVEGLVGEAALKVSDGVVSVSGSNDPKLFLELANAFPVYDVSVVIDGWDLVGTEAEGLPLLAPV